MRLRRLLSHNQRSSVIEAKPLSGAAAEIQRPVARRAAGSPHIRAAEPPLAKAFGNQCRALFNTTATQALRDGSACFPPDSIREPEGINIPARAGIIHEGHETTPGSSFIFFSCFFVSFVDGYLFPHP
jgi:hypothetical protein